MAAKDFPASPVDGQVFETWVWNAANQSWDDLYNGTPPAMLQVSKYATAAARTTAIPTPAEGMITYLDDVNLFQGFAGTEWKGLGGLVPIPPATVAISGGTATANTLGTISFTNVSSVKLNSVFSATYDNYVIIYNITPVSGDTSIQMRMGTTSSATYIYGQMRTNSASLVTFGGTTGTSFYVTSAGNSYGGSNATINLYHPNLATRTKASWIGQGDNGGSEYFSFAGGGQLADNTQYTDVYFFAGTGNITGTVTVYGIAN